MSVSGRVRGAGAATGVPSGATAGPAATAVLPELPPTATLWAVAGFPTAVERPELPLSEGPGDVTAAERSASVAGWAGASPQATSAEVAGTTGLAGAFGFGSAL